MPDEGPAGLIPANLLSRIRQKNCVLFLGADLPLGYPGAPASRSELAAALASEYDLPPGRSFAETAQAFIGDGAGTRLELVNFVKQRCSGPQIKPGPIHQAIAHAGFEAIVSAWYDEQLEAALNEAGLRVHRVVRDRQVTLGRDDGNEVHLVKLYGCLSDPESLALTTWDVRGLIPALGQKMRFVTSFFSVRPLLFVNHDLSDEMLQQLYLLATHDLGELRQPLYAVWPAPDKTARSAWRGQNLELLDRQPLAFLQALAAQSAVTGPAGKAAIQVRRPPYKFLDYYTAQDAEIFCGRDTESQVVARLALSHRLLTLFGPSGAGKTSLLLAGALPRLAGEDYQHVYVRLLDEPRLAVRRAVAARAGRGDYEVGADLRAFFSAMLAKDDRLVVVLDQFEELFLRVLTRQRQTFFEEIAAALHEPERDVRFVFSLREDYLAHLDEASPWLPEIFANRFRLAAFDRSHARVAITEPAARAGVAVEAALVDALVGKEGERDSQAGDLAEAGGEIPLPALQIVLDRLYAAALPPGTDPKGPPPAGVKLTLAGYQGMTCCLGEGAELVELHGARAILASYLDEGLKALPDLKDERGRPLGADPELGWEMLKALVTSSSTKSALSVDELEQLLAEAGVADPRQRADAIRLEGTRLGLAQARLQRSFERDGRAFVELAHDHLAAAVASRLSHEELGAKLARELLRPALENWRLAKQLIPPATLRLIDERRDDLRRLNAAELELQLRSAMAGGVNAGYWFGRAAAGGLDVQAIALEGLRAEGFRARAAAVTALAGLGTQFTPAIAQAIIGMLADDYPQVRMAAIQALETLQPDGEWRAQLKYECYVPAGPFVMGDDHGDSDEKPVHEVNLGAFYIGRYPVTNLDYARFMADRGQPFDVPRGKERYPVVEVSWYDARQYAAWAGMRLLSEAEWEKASSWIAADDEPSSIFSRMSSAVSGRKKGEARGRKLKFPWGDVFDQNKCNTSESGIRTTTEIGKYSPTGDSPYCCTDMAGNVWEWTSSLYDFSYPYRADDGREDLASGERRVVRGGSWLNDGGLARCASRDWYTPDVRYVDFGFRCGWGAPGGGLPDS